jgi:hypothetical protein
MLSGVREVVVIYLDDVIVVTFRLTGEEWAETVNRHGRDVSGVLRELTRNKCRVNWDKFRLGYVRLRMLGHILIGWAY